MKSDKMTLTYHCAREVGW